MNFDRTPTGVGIKLIESSKEQLVISIPPGGARCRFIGFFGLAFLSITTTVSSAFLLVPSNMSEGGRTLPKLFLLPFFSLFYAVSFGFLFAWLRMRFTKILIAVTADQFALQRTWFKSQKFETVALDQDSLAELVESYQENNTPVYTIRIRSADELEKEIKFATRLSDVEKRWLAYAINNFLTKTYGHTFSDSTRCGTELPQGHGKVTCKKCDEEHVIDSPTAAPSTRTAGHSRQRQEDLEGLHASIDERPPSIAPSELPQDSSIRIELSDNETLAFSYRFKITHPIKYVVTAFLAIFCTFWHGVALKFMYSILSVDKADNLFFALIPLLFVLVGLLPLSILVFLIQGRAKIKIDHERITGSIGALLLHKTITIPTRSILDVGIGKPAFKMPMTTLLASNKAVSCIVNSSERDIPLTLSSNSTLNDQVAGLVRGHLKFVGIDLPHEGMEAETAEITG